MTSGNFSSDRFCARKDPYVAKTVKKRGFTKYLVIHNQLFLIMYCMNGKRLPCFENKKKQGFSAYIYYEHVCVAVYLLFVQGSRFFQQRLASSRLSTHWYESLDAQSFSRLFGRFTPRSNFLAILAVLRTLGGLPAHHLTLPVLDQIRLLQAPAGFLLASSEYSCFCSPSFCDL